jgi:hypothetical protein
MSGSAMAATLTVGPGKTYPTVAAAVAASANGDVIQVQTGTYTNDFVTITTNVTIEAVGGRVLEVATVPLPSQKAIWIVGTAVTSPTVTIDGFDFSGAQTPFGSNGAGVLFQSGFLTLTNSSFHNDQDGLRSGPIAVGSVLVDHCEFFNNGINDGLTHDVYVGIIPNFTIQNSYVHDALGGHLIKSRALNTTVINNRLFDNAGNTSYEIDVPQGGNLTVSGNIIQQGTASSNPNIIAYGEELVTQNPGTSIQVSDNTFVNDFTGSAPLGFWNQRTGMAFLTDNSFWGITSPQVAGGTGPNTQVGNTFLGSRPALDTTSLPYKTVYGPVLNLSIINSKLAMLGLTLATVPPGTVGGGGGIPAGAWVDAGGASITDDNGTAITD